MPLFSISAAARAVGKNRATISRHLKQGQLSATKDEKGNIAIDMSELIRVYGELKDKANKKEQPQRKRHVASNNSNTDVTIATLLHELEAAREREKWLKERIEYLERAALPLGEIKKADAQKGFFARLFAVFDR